MNKNYLVWDFGDRESEAEEYEAENSINAAKLYFKANFDACYGRLYKSEDEIYSIFVRNIEENRLIKIDFNFSVELNFRGISIIKDSNDY